MNRQTLLLSYFETMLAELGPSRWWPGETPFEVSIGAILTQNTAWGNVEKAIANLRAHDLLDPLILSRLPQAVLEELIRPAGFFRVKALRIRHFLAFLDRSCGMDMNRLRLADMEKTRAELLEISGIGPETADSILLYALNMPSFVVDAYTHRILNRHMLIPHDIGYEELRDFFMDVLPADVALFNEFHALIVRTGKTWCAKKQGRCTACPLASFLEETAP